MRPTTKENTMLDAYYTPEAFTTIQAAEDLIARLEALRAILTK